MNSEYDDILEKNYKFLDNVRKIRNQYEHRMHGVEYRSSSCGTIEMFEYTFEVKKPWSKNTENLTVSAGEFIITMKMINILFDRIRIDIKKYAEDNGKKDYPYYRKLCRHNFKDFNDIYESDLISTVGRILKAY